MENGEINLNPDFQRKGGIWTDGAQSRLIESLLIRIPLPAFYMDATDEDKWVVVDGLQRLTAIDRFIIRKTLHLTGLEFLRRLEGKVFRDLPRNFQRRILESQVTVYLIEKGAPPEVKFNIFKRINTGGLPLSAQEIRHALNQGTATRFLAELAQCPEFLSATGNSISDNRMGDRECVLRALSFMITPYSQYASKDLDSFLNDRMGDINRMHAKEIDSLGEKFRRAMNIAHSLFGKYTFRKRYQVGGARYPINRALFETWSVNLGSLTDDEHMLLLRKKDGLAQRFIDLMRDRDFEASVSQGTGDPRKVRMRFDAIQDVIREVLTS